MTSEPDDVPWFLAAPPFVNVLRYSDTKRSQSRLFEDLTWEDGCGGWVILHPKGVSRSPITEETPFCVQSFVERSDTFQLDYGLTGSPLVYYEESF